MYAKEVLGDQASYLKLGFTYPLPMQKIKAFADKVDELYVIEELDPFMEEQIRQAGIPCHGKDVIPKIDELNPNIVSAGVLKKEQHGVDVSDSCFVPRPPDLCAGCPHRGFFYELGKRKDTVSDRRHRSLCLRRVGAAQRQGPGRLYGQCFLRCSRLQPWPPAQ